MNKIFPCAGRGGDCTGVRDLVRFRLRGRRSQWDQDRRGKDCKAHAWMNLLCPIQGSLDHSQWWPDAFVTSCIGGCHLGLMNWCLVFVSRFLGIVTLTLVARHERPHLIWMDGWTNGWIPYFITKKNFKRATQCVRYNKYNIHLSKCVKFVFTSPKMHNICYTHIWRRNSQKHIIYIYNCNFFSLKITFIIKVVEIQAAQEEESKGLHIQVHSLFPSLNRSRF